MPHRFETYPLLDALIHRRSRRFARGFRLDGGPLAFLSRHAPKPLSLEEEAALAFAACGTTGPIAADLPYDSGGQIMMRFTGRTAPSGDALHTVSVIVINDDGVWLLKRPQDYPPQEVPALAQAAREHRLVDLYQTARVQIADRRLDIPRTQPFLPSFNQWSANLPGTTYFVPVNEYTAIYINMVLTAVGEDFGYFVLDDRAGFQPAGLAPFARSQGGHLLDSPEAGRVATISFLESWLYELVAVEQGAILQNLGLMAEALGLGGFPHFAAHPFIWFQTLGFRMQEIPMMGLAVPSAVGLERDGDPLLRPFCPPYYADMRAAVLAFVDTKYRPNSGTFRDGGASTAWRHPTEVQGGIPEYSQATIDAAIAYCDYVYSAYGRFPGSCGPFRTVLAYQAHHLDPEFYERYYNSPESASSS